MVSHLGPAQEEEWRAEKEIVEVVQILQQVIPKERTRKR